MRTFGHILGVEVGDIFESRATLAKVGIHPPTQAGISGGAKEGANSIVLSGGYEDDEDFGDEIIYTGAGGRDENSGKQIADQRLERTNMALAKNSLEGLPVRVTRSHKHPSNYSPSKGFQYAGLYRVVDYWCENGLSG
ncbi:YDG/SRA domain-containing protein [Vibrio astriarenae]